MNVKKIALLLGIICFFIFIVLSAQRRVIRTVVLTKNGFEPKRLTILSGGSVRFVTTAGRAFWPASNYHPTHGIYPEFDPKHTLTPDESWLFRFTERGEWEYHDHTAPKFTGIVRVIDPFAWMYGKKDPCTKNATQGGGEVNCWIRIIRSKLTSGGLSEALLEFNRLYTTNPAFASGCHDVAHVVGYAGYRQFAKDGDIFLPAETSYCGYGFYHGFIEALLLDGQDFQKARAMCESVQESLSKTIQAPQGKNSCYHGVGHGAFDAVDSRRWGDAGGMVQEAVDICRVFAGNSPDDADLFRLCTTGVFNALAIAYQNTSYSLAFDGENPLGLCRNQPELLQKGCFMELGVSFIRMSQMDIARAISFLRAGNTSLQASYILFAYMADEMRVSSGIPGAMHKLVFACRNMRDPERRACVEGVAHGLLTWGTPAREWESAVAFCSDPDFSTRDRDVCFQYVLVHMKNLYAGDKVANICARVPEVYQQFCK